MVSNHEPLTEHSEKLGGLSLAELGKRRKDMTKVTAKTKQAWGWNIHPGEILREEYMKPLGLSVYHLAKDLKLTRPRMNDIVLERRAITADTAIRLARYFGTAAQFWMNMQSSYELREAENANRKIVESIAPHRIDAA
jgi:addiction module HigA family antidote